MSVTAFPNICNAAHSVLAAWVLLAARGRSHCESRLAGESACPTTAGC